MMRLDLDGLADASREALMSEWREVVGHPPPKHLSRPCFSPLKLCHYLMVTGGFKVGTETVFGRRCSKGFA